jgi:hypothetical protein
VGDVHDLEVGEDEHAVLLLLQLGQQLVEQHELAAGGHEEVGLGGEGQVARLVFLLELRLRGRKGRVRRGGGRGGREVVWVGALKCTAIAIMVYIL